MTVPVVVDPGWLQNHVSGEAVVPIDVRQYFFYHQAHLPGARSLLPFAMYGPDSGMPTREVLARTLGLLGVTPATHLVAYDEGASPSASRLYFVLNSFGHQKVSVLEGGFRRWVEEGRPVEDGPGAVTTAVDFPLGASPTGVIGRHELVSIMGRPDTAVVDVRSPAEYCGLQRTAARDGHIPGAVNIEWDAVLSSDPHHLPELLPNDELTTLFARDGVTPDKRVVVYCQSGNRSSHTYMILKKLGFPDVRNYSAGWQEWGNDPGSPVAAD